MAFVKFSLLTCFLAAVSAAPQFAYPPPAATVVHHAPAAVVHHAPAVVTHAYAPPALTHVTTHVAAHPYARIVSQNYDSAPDGSYSFQYQSEDGSTRSEQGSPRFAKTNQPGVEPFGGIAVQGSYSYASPEGPVEVQYLADENGYQPSGPGVHPDIQKAVAEQVALARQEGPYPPGPAGPARYVQAKY